MDERILKMLYEPFKLQERRGVGNKVFKYVPSEDIVDRMNKVFQGSWSTEVREKEILEDQILLCIRVYVRDPRLTDKTYWHDGYASHPIARYTSGMNNGKAIDIGNSFKSAMSKAIKTAVSKWGVALYLDGEAADTPSSFLEAPAAAPQASQAPFETPPSTSTTTTGPPSMPDFATPPAPKEEKPDTTTMPPTGFIAPPTGAPAAKTETSAPPAAPFATVENMEEPSSFTPSNSEIEEFCTAVQQVAITTVMESHSLSFEDLAKKALTRENDLPENIDKLKYTDAVKLIQYGNELSKV